MHDTNISIVEYIKNVILDTTDKGMNITTPCYHSTCVTLLIKSYEGDKKECIVLLVWEHKQMYVFAYRDQSKLRLFFDGNQVK